MHLISRYEMIMRWAVMAMWHACAALAIWLADMQIVLLSTHLTEIDQTKSKKQSGACADPRLFYPQHPKCTCRHYENGRNKICAHLCVCHCARLHCTPGHCENYLETWGGTQCESKAQIPCASGACSWAGRACDMGQMRADSHVQRVGGNYGAVWMMVWCREGWDT